MERKLLFAPERAPIDPKGKGPAIAGFGPVKGAHHYELQTADDTEFLTEVRSVGVSPEGEAKLPMVDVLLQEDLVGIGSNG